jgi:predicted transcriptional regulator
MDKLLAKILGLTRANIKVYEYIKTNNISKHPTDILANNLEMHQSTVQRSVKTLTELGLLKQTQINLQGGGYEYYYKLSPKKERDEIIKQELDTYNFLN